MREYGDEIKRDYKSCIYKKTIIKNYDNEIEKENLEEKKKELKDSGIDKECRKMLAITFLVLVFLEVTATLLTIYKDEIF